ncbi:MAG: insulinase family protein, partial [Deltaproteobacteria bacterium]|nr:insulinase family protein [Deltaproteobacteria bacterium]
MTGSGFSRIRAFIFPTVLLCCIASSCTRDIARPYKNLKFPRLGDVEMPRVQSVTLANGMRLFLVEDHELPLISISARIRTGSIYEPADKIGLAEITGTVMRTGGTTSKTGDQLDEQLERIAASVETGI